jgi:hypothetical protein
MHWTCSSVLFNTSEQERVQKMVRGLVKDYEQLL